MTHYRQVSTEYTGKLGLFDSLTTNQARCALIGPIEVIFVLSICITFCAMSPP